MSQLLQAGVAKGKRMDRFVRSFELAVAGMCFGGMEVLRHLPLNFAVIMLSVFWGI